MKLKLITPVQRLKDLPVEQRQITRDFISTRLDEEVKVSDIQKELETMFNRKVGILEIMELTAGKEMN